MADAVVAYSMPIALLRTIEDLAAVGAAKTEVAKTLCVATDAVM
jgi:hypothetical protein